MSDGVHAHYSQLVASLGSKDFVLGGTDLNIEQQNGSNCFNSAPVEEEQQLLEQLGHIHNALDSVKGQVHAICARHGTDRWHSFTSFTHPLKALPGWIAAKMNMDQHDEMPPLYTQAFCKFVQLIIAHPDLLKPVRQAHGSIRTLHLCELPGAFVFALMHVLDADQLSRLDWHMNGLNAELVDHQQQKTFSSSTPSVVQLLAEQEGRMALGRTNSGDILEANNWDDAYLKEGFGIIDELNGKEDNKFELVTADGGFDCTNDPSGQERLAFPLIKSEAELAIKCLKKGGTLLLKAFTFFELETVELLANLCVQFGQMHCVKPPSSKPGNSEIYLLCLDFTGPTNIASFDRKSFLNRLLGVARALAGHQIGFIQFNLRTFRRMAQDERTLISIEKCKAVEQWGAKLIDEIRNLPLSCAKNSNPQG